MQFDENTFMATNSEARLGERLGDERRRRKGREKQRKGEWSDCFDGKTEGQM